MKISLLALVVALAGCATAPEPTPVPKPAVMEKQTVDINPQLMLDCPTVSLLPEGKNLSREQLLKFNADLIVATSTCWHRHHDLSGLAAKAFNLNSQ